MASLVKSSLVANILAIFLAECANANIHYARQSYLWDDDNLSFLRHFYVNRASFRHGLSPHFGPGEAISSRQSTSSSSGLYNNRYSNSQTLNSIISPILLNLNALNGYLSSFDPCFVPNGPSGICVLQTACSLIGGQAAGSCDLGRACCVKCSGIATLNNTYFQNPAELPASTLCSLTVKIDRRLYEQRFAVCQIRLDFIRFNIAQPAPGGNTATEQARATQCLTDNFQIEGGLNTVPTICGENTGQHMYLHVPRSDVTPSEIRLTFNLGSSAISRSWKIKIAMLACGSETLAPDDCLQYFTSAYGTVSSFNWMDVRVDGSSVRQLANQNYRVCFRTEKIDGSKKATEICYSECSVPNGGDAFLLTTKGGTGAARAGGSDCPDDYVFIANGVSAVGGASADRLCGNFMDAAGASSTATSSITVCAKPEPFALHYSTDDSEKYDVTTGQGTEANNSGFCLRFQQKT